MSDDLRQGLTGWSEATKAALGPALEEAAATVAAEVSGRLSAEGQAAAVTMNQADNPMTVAVTLPGAASREYGTRTTSARPFFRPAVAAVRSDMGRRIAKALRQALPQGRFR